MRAQLWAIASAITAVTAILLPPDVSSSDTDIINTLPFEDAIDIDGRVVTVSCPECPVSDQMHSVKTPSMLRLNFSIAHADGDRLLLNGVQIYPLDPQSQLLSDPLTVDQLVKAPDDTWAYTSSPRIGYSLSVHHPVQSQEDQLGLAMIHLEIVEVADRFVNGIPSVDLKLVEIPGGKLMVGDVELSTPTAHTDPTDSEKECTNLLCKWRAIVAGKLSKFKGCAGKAGSNTVDAQPGSRPHGHGRPRPHSPPGPHRPHRPHRHHMHHRFTRLLRSAVMHVFIPILIGLVAGITASLVGVVVGHIAIFLWRMLYRRGQKPKYIKIRQDKPVAEISDDESDGLVTHEGPPPVYEEVVVVEKPSE